MLSVMQCTVNDKERGIKCWYNKKLALSELATVLIILGILKEFRLILKIILDHHLEIKKLNSEKVRGD